MVCNNAECNEYIETLKQQLREKEQEIILLRAMSEELDEK